MENRAKRKKHPRRANRNEQVWTGFFRAGRGAEASGNGGIRSATAEIVRKPFVRRPHGSYLAMNNTNTGTKCEERSGAETRPINPLEQSDHSNIHSSAVPELMSKLERPQHFGRQDLKKRDRVRKFQPGTLPCSRLAHTTQTISFAFIASGAAVNSLVKSHAQSHQISRTGGG